MLGNAQFYHRTIRKMVVVFGTLFNDLEIVRYTQSGVPKEKLKVPLSYGPKERYLTQITSDPNLIKSVNSVIPRMSFNLDSLEYDMSRKQVSTLQNFAAATNTGVATQFLPVPYNFEFSLSIYVRNTEDGTQILEQILPFFTPDFSVVVDFIPQMNQKYTVPIILNSVASTVEYEGGMSDGTTRLILWDLTFTAKSFIWPPVKSGKLINAANTNINIDLTSKELQKVYVDYANGTSVFTTGETIRDTANGFIGTVDFFSNTATGTLVITGGNKYIERGYTLTGDYSGASYNVATLDINSVNAAAVITEPDPTSSLPNANFGYIETITEWPDTLI
jgi:hypothetical protein